MPVSLLKTKDTEPTLHYPLAGLNVVSAYAKQPNMPIDQSIGWYARTSPLILNCRSYDSFAGRARGGSRGGLDRLLNTPLESYVQHLGVITGVGYTDPGGGVQTSSLGRLVTGVAVSNGNIKLFAPGNLDDFIIPTNGLGALNATGVCYSATCNAKLFFADGTHWKYFDPSANTVTAMVATAGTLPTDANGHAPRLICTWRGRLTWSGLIDDPQNWFMARVDRPFDYDYSPLSQTPVQAVAGNNSPLGLVGDVVTSLIPYTDDVLVFGGDHTLWTMQGDPMDGGRLLRISDALGTVWGTPWCSDPKGNIYFWGSDCRLYTINPLADRPQPIPISDQITPLLEQVNTGSNTITMAWDRKRVGMHVFVTRTANAYPAIHLYYDANVNAWSTDFFKNKNFNPLCCCVFDGNLSDDRVILIGSWDGYIRWFNDAATTDDGEQIPSAVVIGPILTSSMDAIKALEMQAVLGEGSGRVRYDIFVGKTAEKALTSTPTLTGYWGAENSGRNYTVPVNREGYAIFVKLSSTDRWAMESVRVSLRGLGPVLRRGA